MRSIVFSTLLALLLSAPVGAAEDLRNDYSVAEIIQMLKAEGYGAIREMDTNDGTRFIEIKVDGYTYSMQIFDDGDLLLYFGMTGFSLTPENINEWNRQQRLSRAYIDHENDPVLEADLLADAGYSAQHLARFVRVFIDLSNAFHDFLIDMDKGEDNEPLESQARQIST